MGLFGDALDGVVKDGVKILNKNLKDVKPIETEVSVSKSTWIGLAIGAGLLIFFKPIRKIFGIR